MSPYYDYYDWQSMCDEPLLRFPGALMLDQCLAKSWRAANKSAPNASRHCTVQWQSRQSRQACTLESEFVTSDTDLALPSSAPPLCVPAGLACQPTHQPTPDRAFQVGACQRGVAASVFPCLNVCARRCLMRCRGVRLLLRRRGQSGGMPFLCWSSLVRLFQVLSACDGWMLLQCRQACLHLPQSLASQSGVHVSALFEVWVYVLGMCCMPKLSVHRMTKLWWMLTARETCYVI